MAQKGFAISSAPQLYAAIPSPTTTANANGIPQPLVPSMPMMQGYHGYGMHPMMMPHMAPMMTHPMMMTPTMMPGMSGMPSSSSSSVVRPLPPSSTPSSSNNSGSSRAAIIPVIQPTKTEMVNGVTIITVQQGAPPPPPCNVFVGRIPSNLADQTIRLFLEKCGRVVKWARESDPTTKRPKKFGYCEFAQPHAALRAFRLLPTLDFEFTGQKERLLLNADKNTKAILEDFERHAPKPLDAGDDNVILDMDMIMADFKKKFDLEVQTGLQWKDTPSSSSSLSSSSSSSSSSTAITATAVAGRAIVASSVVSSPSSSSSITNSETSSVTPSSVADSTRSSLPIAGTTDNKLDDKTNGNGHAPSSSSSSRYDRDSRHSRHSRRSSSRDHGRTHSSRDSRSNRTSSSNNSRTSRSSRKSRHSDSDDSDDRDRRHRRDKKSTTKKSRRDSSRSRDRKKNKHKTKSSRRRSSSSSSSSSPSSSRSRSRSSSSSRRSSSRDKTSSSSVPAPPPLPSSLSSSSISPTAPPPPPPPSVPPATAPAPPAAPPPGALIMEEGRSIGFSLSMTANKKRSSSLLPSHSSSSLSSSSSSSSSSSAMMPSSSSSSSLSLSSSYGAASTISARSAASTATAFAQVETVDSIYSKKKARLTPLDFTDDELKAMGRQLQPIPTTRVDLYRYDIPWQILDMFDMINTSVRTFLEDAVTKYLGQAEDTLVSFILDLVKKHQSASDIQSELEGVMSARDAEKMVMSLWTRMIELTRSVSSR